MKKVCRDVTITVLVPDHADIDDVEIVTTSKASYAGQDLDGTLVAEPLYMVEPEPPKPICPKCSKEIDSLVVYWPATVVGTAEFSNGGLNVEIDHELSNLNDITREDEQTYCCPECDEQLFKAGDEDRVAWFLENVSTNS